MKLPLQVNLKDKVVVITGAGGVICSTLAKAYAESGAKVALLDLNKENAERFASELREEGYTAYGYEANVLKKDSLEACHQEVLLTLGPCDILVNGAGGNNPRATTDNEFAKLDQFKLLRNPSTHPSLLKRYDWKKRLFYPQYLLYERLHSSHQNSCLFWCKSGYL